MNLSMERELPSHRRTHSVSMLHQPRLRLLRLDEICFTEVVDGEFLERSGFRLLNQPPVVVPLGCVVLILDGNHRCAYEFVVRKQRTVECAVWTPDPQVKVHGIQLAVEAHRVVAGAADGLAPGLIVYK